MTTYILYNPVAGTPEKINAALSATDTADIRKIDITQTDVKAFLSEKSEEDTVILYGGDGTLNRTVNAMEGDEIKCKLMLYGAGTGNDFLRDVEHTENSPLQVNDYIKDLPIAEVNGKSYRFINNVGFGIDGYCCEVGDKLKAQSDKPVNYTSIAIKGLLFHFKPTNATVVVDGKEYKYKKVWIAPTMKGRFYGGGMMPTPDQNRGSADGELSVMIFHGTGKLKTLLIFPSLFKGEHIKHTKHITIHKGNNISVSFDRPTSLQIDGETHLGVTQYKASATNVSQAAVTEKTAVLN